MAANCGLLNVMKFMRSIDAPNNTVKNTLCTGINALMGQLHNIKNAQNMELTSSIRKPA